MDKTLNLIEHAIIHLDKEIQSPYPVSPPPQLSEIREEMQGIIHMLRSGKLPQKANRKSGIGRLIVDEWRMDSRIGNQILEALSAYYAL